MTAQEAGIDRIPQAILDDFLSDRDRVIIALRDQEGKTFTAIGRQLGVTKARISQLYNRSVRRIHHVSYVFDNPLNGLSVRAVNCLQKIGVKTREQAVNLYAAGRLDTLSMRGYGRKTHYEICRWMRVSEDSNWNSQLHHCPVCGWKLRAKDVILQPGASTSPGAPTTAGENPGGGAQGPPTGG